MALAAEFGDLRLVLPFAALERVVPMPLLHPAPAAGRCALGYGVAAEAPVLVLDRPGAEAPLLRLAGPQPVALAVSHVTGLRRIPEHLIAAVAGEHLVSAVVAMGESPLPICRGAMLGALR